MDTQVSPCDRPAQLPMCFSCTAVYLPLPPLKKRNYPICLAPSPPTVCNRTEIAVVGWRSDSRFDPARSNTRNARNSHRLGTLDASGHEHYTTIAGLGDSGLDHLSIGNPADRRCPPNPCADTNENELGVATLGRRATEFGISDLRGGEGRWTCTRTGDIRISRGQV